MAFSKADRMTVFENANGQCECTFLGCPYRTRVPEMLQGRDRG